MRSPAGGAIHSSPVALIDYILNLAGLLVWLHWRAMRFDPLARTAPATLVGTLRRTEPQRLKPWQLLLGLGSLLVIRAWLYWQIGSAAGWTASMHLGFVVLAFRSDFFPVALLYSFVSFVRVLVIVYFWLVILVLVNGREPEVDPIQRLIRLHLGRLVRWPRLLLFLLPFALTTVLWVCAHPLLEETGVINAAHSPLHVCLQGLLVSLALVATLKYLLPAVLFAHLVANYVYLGSSPLWDFTAATSRRLLGPLRVLPLRVGRLDLAPLAGAVLLLLLLDALPNYVLVRFPDLRRAIWPA